MEIIKLKGTEEDWISFKLFIIEYCSNIDISNEDFTISINNNIKIEFEIINN